MLRRVKFPHAVIAAVALLACAPSARRPGSARPDRQLLSSADLLKGNFINVYDAIASLRSSWLVVRGADSFSNPSEVVVYQDAIRLGNAETLRRVPIRDAKYIRHYDGVAATARYGMGHSAGVILISLFSSPPPPGSPGDSTSQALAHAPAPAQVHGPSAMESIAEPSTASTLSDAAAVGTAESSAVVPTRASYVSASASPKSFPLSVSGISAPLTVSANDHIGVQRALGDLRVDLGRVTGAEPLLRVAAGAAPDSIVGGAMVIVGTIGHSTLIDRLVRERKLDVRSITGKWETFLTQTIERPLPGVARALVIAGSDKRGTIYGIYDLSAQIGMSPWYWWADVPVVRRTQLHVAAGVHTQGTPAVKYRGIFINDEAPAFSGWAREQFGGINHKAYERVFELLLRLKGNYLWPAMWGSAFADDDSLSARLADEYGVVMGTSHHEPLTRAQAEWPRYAKGEWNYEHNDSTLRAFWRGGIERMGTRENIVTVGMRGDGDMPMTEGSNIALLQRIVSDQRAIIADVTRKPASATPQIWALYKEVQDYYDKGMRVPEDVTLLFSDDNWGNIRRLPTAKDRGRSGGFGVYYHFDYVGGPRNYKWLNTNPIARVWEQLNLAYTSGADRVWIVNVGDIKLMEYPIQFFLDYAWNPSAVPASRLPEYGTQWAAQQFGEEQSAEVGAIIRETLQLIARRKPELLDVDTYSLLNFGESDRVLAEYASLEARADSVMRKLPSTHRDAFYQLVQHPLQAAANITELYATVARNRLYAQQGRAATNMLADRARMLFERDAEISRKYNTELSGGKWNHMMDQTHIGYTYWQEPPRNTMPRVDVIQLPLAAGMGVAVVEENRPPLPSRNGGGPPGGVSARALAMPPFDPYQQQRHAFDVYNRGQTPFEMSARSDASWLVISPSSATVRTEQRVTVQVDWSKVPTGTQRASIMITGPSGATTVVQAVVNNPATPRPADVRGFVASAGIVSMEAEHRTRTVNTSDVTWEVIPGLGRTLSGMHVMAATAPSRLPSAASARLEYDVTVFDSGTVSIQTYLSPTLNVTGAASGLRYGISIDDEAPQLVNITADSSNGAWERAVANNARVHVTKHRVATAGVHTIKYWFVDPAVVLQKLVLSFGELPQSYLGPPESFHRAGVGGGEKR